MLTPLAGGVLAAASVRFWVPRLKLPCFSVELQSCDACEKEDDILMANVMRVAVNSTACKMPYTASVHE